MNEQRTPVVVSQNPLDKIELSFHDSFDEWLNSWNATTDYALLLGLLHGLQINDKAFEKRKTVPFLLQIADGYQFQVQFPYNPRPQKKLAQKALSVLCTRFFKATGDFPGPENREWWWALYDEETLEKILWFFRFEESRYDLCNCKHPVIFEPNDHEQKTVVRFLREFARLSWRIEGYPTKRILISVRPQCIEILNWLRELDWLFGKELDSPSIEKLKEIALRAKYYLPLEEVGQRDNCRKPQNLDEAVLGRSSAAYVLAIHTIVSDQKAHFNKKFDLSTRQRELDLLNAKMAG